MSFFRRKQITEETVSYYHSEPAHRDYSKPPSAHQLTHDLNKAHDNIRRLVGEKDRLRSSYNYLHVWSRVLTAGVLGSWAVILILLKMCIAK